MLQSIISFQYFNINVHTKRQDALHYQLLNPDPYLKTASYSILTISDNILFWFLTSVPISMESYQKNPKKKV